MLAARSSDIEYALVRNRDHRLQAVLEALGVSYKEGGINLRILLRSFRPVNKAARAETARFHLQGLGHWLKSFVQAESVRAAVPELQIPYPLAEIPGYVLYTGYEFEGAVTSLLLSGESLGRRKITDDSARAMSRAFVDSLIGKRRRPAFVFRIDGAWTSWFLGLARDLTFIVFLPGEGRWVLFCVTGTD